VGWTVRAEEAIMMTEPQTELRGQVLLYLEKQISLHDFEDHLLGFLWDLADSPDSTSRELAGHIHNLIEEFSCGHYSEIELRREMADAIRPFDRITVPVWSRIPPKKAALISDSEIEADQKAAPSSPYIFTQGEQTPAAA
jgi:hypothetical protein